MSKVKTIAEIPLSQIDLKDDTFKNRKSIGKKDLKLLVQSLKLEGQQVPAELRLKRNGTYQIISGFRRCTALKMLRKKYVLAFVHPTDKDIFALHRLSLLENLQRENLTRLEKIDACAYLHKQQKMPKKELAKIYGVGVRAIENYISVSTKSSPELRHAFGEGILTLHQARALVGSNDEKIKEAIVKADKGKFTVSQAKKLVGKRTSIPKPINQIRRFKKGFNLKVRFRLDYDRMTKKKIKKSLQEAIKVLESDTDYELLDNRFDNIPYPVSERERRDYLAGYWKGKLKQKNDKDEMIDVELTATIDVSDATISGVAQFISFYGKLTKVLLYDADFDGKLLNIKYKNELRHIHQEGSITGILNAHGDKISGMFTGYSPSFESVISGEISLLKEKTK